CGGAFWRQNSLWGKLKVSRCQHPLKGGVTDTFNPSFQLPSPHEPGRCHPLATPPDTSTRCSRAGPPGDVGFLAVGAGIDAIFNDDNFLLSGFLEGAAGSGFRHPKLLADGFLDFLQPVTIRAQEIPDMTRRHCGIWVDGGE